MKKKSDLPPPQQPRQRGFLVLLLLFISLLLFTFYIANPTQSKQVSWSELITLIHDGKRQQSYARSDRVIAEMVKGYEHQHVSANYLSGRIYRGPR